jgi:hypothetical protein
VAGHIRTEARRLAAHRRCFLCLRSIPEAGGTYHSDLGCLLCSGICSDEAKRLRRDYSRSEHGHWREPTAVLKDLRRVRDRGEERIFGDDRAGEV